MIEPAERIARSAGRDERANVVEGQDARDKLFEVELVFHNPHEQRNLKADEHADEEDDGVEYDVEEA